MRAIIAAILCIGSFFEIDCKTRVHVGVHLNFEKSNTGKIPFTDILAQTLAPRFQQQFPGDATLADRSNKQKQEEEGGPPNETTLKCQGDMWLEECKAGKIRTFRNLTKALCNLFCQKQTSCKAYIFDQSGNCGLLPDDPEGTTQTHGILGPVVKLRKPSQLMTGMNKKPMRTNEDCSEFHFEKCNKDINHPDVKFSNVYRPEDCLNMCNKGLLFKNCRSWAWSYEEGSEGGSSCWNSVSNQSELIRLGCIKFYGRVGQRSGEMEEVDGAEKYDSCITGGDSNWKCRKGDCTLWPQYGDVIKSERPHIQESEWHCKQLCYGITGCTYYKWSSYTKQCDLHYASEVPVPPNSECYSLAARADIGKEMCNIVIDCQWGEWETWSSCSQTCGTGKRSRNRKEAASAFPPGIGKECDATIGGQETESCSLEECQSKLELMEIKTLNEPGASADLSADITICHQSLPNCCDIENLDDPEVDEWEEGALVSYRGNLLQGCDGFLLPENRKTPVTVEIDIYKGSMKHWGGEYVKLTLESGKTFQCPLDWMVDGDQKTFDCNHI